MSSVAGDPNAMQHRPEAAKTAELTQLRRENEKLRDRVEELEHALALRMNVPAGFSGISVGGRRQVWHFICALARRGTLTRDAAMVALYGDKHPDERPDPHVLAVYSSAARKFLARHGVTFNTVWGEGWSMTRTMQIRTQQIIARLAKGEAA
jgi:two-component system cell cycle response regulator CtrA